MRVGEITVTLTIDEMRASRLVTNSLTVALLEQMSWSTTQVAAILRVAPSTILRRARSAGIYRAELTAKRKEARTRKRRVQRGQEDTAHVAPVPRTTTDAEPEDS